MIRVGFRTQVAETPAYPVPHVPTSSFYCIVWPQSAIGVAIYSALGHVSPKQLIFFPDLFVVWSCTKSDNDLSLKTRIMSGKVKSLCAAPNYKEKKKQSVGAIRAPVPQNCFSISCAKMTKNNTVNKAHASATEPHREQTCTYMLSQNTNIMPHDVCILWQQLLSLCGSVVDVVECTISCRFCATYTNAILCPCTSQRILATPLIRQREWQTDRRTLCL